jgi:hypothetical protein
LAYSIDDRVDVESFPKSVAPKPIKYYFEKDGFTMQSFDTKKVIRQNIPSKSSFELCPIKTK